MHYILANGEAGGDVQQPQQQYTGHEGLHEVGIVHMNGRIYDPKLGRVLSADPYVQAPGDGQSYNRYSYAFNNPLLYTDPSGFMAQRLCFQTPCDAPGNARVGMVGSGSSRPQLGIAVTRRGSRLGSWAMASLNEIGRILAANAPRQGCDPVACFMSGEPGFDDHRFDFNWWMSSSSPQPWGP